MLLCPMKKKIQTKPIGQRQKNKRKKIGKTRMEKNKKEKSVKNKKKNEINKKKEN